MAEQERRAEERYPPGSDTLCNLVSPVVENFGPAKIKNLSRDGIGLLTSKKVEIGSLLAISVSSPSKSFNKVFLVRVAHCSPQTGGGIFLVGGTFQTPLTYDELKTLIF